MPLKSNNRIGLSARVATMSLAIGLSYLFLPTTFAQDGRERGRDRDFDVIRYLDRADRDDDGMLTDRELGGRMKRYVQELGIDTSKPVSVSKITRAYEKKKELEANAELMKEIDGNRKVAKFGEPTELVPPPTFAIAGDAGETGNLEDLYDQGTVDTVRAYMRRYDENKDGWLDENESRRIRRVLGEGADSDENGKLGELEVAAALKKRMGNSDSGGGDGESRRRGRRGGGESDRGGRDRGSTNRRSFTGASQPAQSRSKQETSKSPTSSSAGRSMSGRQTAYVDGLLKRYDEDKNGKLSLDEQKKISGSLKLVDENGDGEVDRQEALNSLAGKAKPAEQVVAKTPTSTRRSRRRRSRDSDDDGSAAASAESEDALQARDFRGGSSGRSSSSNSSNNNSDIKFDIRGFENVQITIEAQRDIESYLEGKGASRDFLSFDSNLDGRISMAEFRDDQAWTDELVGRFQKLDDNDDGSVSITEFNENFRDLKDDDDDDDDDDRSRRRR